MEGPTFQIKNKPGAKLFGANIPPTHDNAIASHSPLQTFINFSQNEYSKIAFIFSFLTQPGFSIFRRMLWQPGAKLVRA